MTTITETPADVPENPRPPAPPRPPLSEYKYADTQAQMIINNNDWA